MKGQRQGHKMQWLSLLILATIVGWMPMGCSVIANDRRPPDSISSPTPVAQPQASPKAASPKAASPKAASPKAASPKASPIVSPTVSPTSNPTKKVALTPINRQLSRQQLVDANTRFGLKLFQQIQQQQPDTNLFVSPSSVAIALSMAYNGASGDTQKAMNQALQLNGMDVAVLNQANESLHESLEGSDRQVKLKIANSLWAKQGINFNPAFLQRNQNFYQAKVSSLDFTSNDTLGLINNWVKRNTEGKIPKILDRINPDDVMFLINAVYFKGDWTVPFEKSATKNEPFTLGNGEVKQLPTMRQSGLFRYYENAQFQAVNLPYGSGRWSMYVFLPKSKSNLAEFSQTLTAANWQTWMKEFRPRQGYVQLPKFKTEFSTELKAPLTALGMGLAFDRGKADFSNLTQEMPLFISQVKHKTFVEVNEAGTEAAAVTGVAITTTSAMIPQNPFSLVLDRPFFCAIRDNETGTILFLGTIQDPSAS